MWLGLRCGFGDGMNICMWKRFEERIGRLGFCVGWRMGGGVELIVGKGVYRNVNDRGREIERFFFRLERMVVRMIFFIRVFFSFV